MQPSLPRNTPEWAKKIFATLESHSTMLETHKGRLDALEGVYTDIEDIRRFTKKSWNVLKFGAPSIISALVAAGWVNGDIANILRAIFG